MSWTAPRIKIPYIQRMAIPGYTRYANPNAFELAELALVENNRLKATKMKKIADKMEDKYRQSKEFKQEKRLYGIDGIDLLYKSLTPPKPPRDHD